MTAFHTIAIPHDDILEGRLTMDVFAADLWEVYKGRGADEYKKNDIFFQKTFPTEGLNSLLDVVQSRLAGNGGDPVIQVQTPFGGGKTHALIAMFHKTAEWKAKQVVVVGTPLAGNETLWGLMAEQLNGNRKGFEGKVAPGRDDIQELLSPHQPLLILMDELLQYVTKAAGVKVGENTLAAQTIAFMQELTEAAGNLEKVSLVITLPSSLLEHYDDRAEQLFNQMQRVSGRVEKIYTPVQEHEITNVIRCRLFSQIDEKAMKKVIDSFMDYANKESIIPAGMEPSEFRERFEDSYPFLPEVVDVLYHRWGSFSSFQRTRGVLRLLALVIHDLKEKALPFVSLADIELSNSELRRELLKHIGPEFDSVIAADITGADSGSSKVDSSMGKAYQGLNLGTRAATSIFMHSFSGGPEKGATLSDIKRTATTLDNPTSAVVEASESLKESLFYIQVQGGKFYFTNQPNLTHALLRRMENVEKKEIEDTENELLKTRFKGDKFKVIPWPENTSDVPDTPELKLILIAEGDLPQMKEILEKKGETPRVHRNTLFFLVPLESERPQFENMVRRFKGFEQLGEDKTLSLTNEQEKEIKDALKSLKGDLGDSVRRLYRQLYLPGKDGLISQDMGIPTFGESKPMDTEIYEKLRLDGEILEGIAPLVIKERYLHDKDWVLTRQLAEAGLKTPGEARAISSYVWDAGIAEGVRKGLFGIGELEDDQPVCRYFKEEPSVSLSGNEILISAEISQQQKDAEAEGTRYPGPETPDTGGIGEPGTGEVTTVVTPQSGDTEDLVSKINLDFRVPKGQVSGVMGVMNYLQSRFNLMEISLKAEDGSITEQEFEDKIIEAFRQMGINIE